MITSESNKILSILQSLTPSVCAKPPDILLCAATVLSIIPNSSYLACQFGLIDLVLSSEFFSDAFANKFRYRLASLPAHYRKDSRNIVVQIELCPFHRDVYYTSRCQIARPFVAPFEAKGVYCSKRLSARSKNLRRGVHPKAGRTIR